MSALTTGSFTSAEQARVTERITEETNDLASVDAEIAQITALQAKVQELDDANQRVQNSAIDTVVDILLAVITARDIGDPGDAPHKIKFIAPDPSGGDGFPVTLGTMDVAGGKPSIPAYATPFVGATMANGDFGGGTGGWELFRNDGMGGDEPDPSQPSGGELTAAYTTALAEFDTMQNARLISHRGSYVFVAAQTAILVAKAALRAMIMARNAVYESIGFSAP